METEIINTIQTTLQELLDRDSIELTSESSAADVEGWDSLIHVNIIFSLESILGLKFTTKEITSFKKVGDLVEIIKNKQTDG